MWFILTILFFAGLALTTAKLSLIRGFKWLPVALSTALFPLLFVSRTVRLNMRHIAEIVNDYGVVTTICTVVIAESLIVMLLSIRLMSNHYGEQKTRLWSKLIYAPSATAIAGFILLQTVLFNMISGQTFMTLAVLDSSVAFLAMGAGLGAVRLIMRDWLRRLELTVVLAFFQLVIAMFIPIIAAGLELPETQFAIDMRATLITFGTVLTAAVIGYLLRVSLFPRLKGYLS